MPIINGTESNFNEEIKDGLVLVDFWAPWCGPCKMLLPVLDELSKEFGDRLKIVKVNVDEESGVSSQLNVMSIPTVFVFKNGNKVEEFTGFQPKDAIASLLNKHL